MKLQAIIALLIFYSFALQAQQVKSYSEVIFNNGVTTYNGLPYTGEVIDSDARGHLTYQGNYKNGSPAGEVRAWFIHDSVKGGPEFDYNYDENGLLNGTSTDWCEKGQKLTEINYLHGKKDGKATYYDDSCTGIVTAEINYKGDSLNGDWTIYKNGIKRYVDTYSNGMFMSNQVFSAEGKPDSTWTTYDENGNESHTYWHNGMQDKTAHYLVSNYTFNSVNSYLMKIPVGPHTSAYAEFIVNNPYPQNGQYNAFVNKIWTYFVKQRGALFIKQVDFPKYNNDTITYVLTLTNISVAYTTHRYTNSYGTVSAQYTVNLDADLTTTNLGNNSSGTVHFHSNTPAIGISQNGANGAYASALDRDELKTTAGNYLSAYLPFKATLTQIVSSEKDGDAETVILNAGTADNITEDMKFKYSGTASPATGKEPIEIRVKSVDANQCTCKVLSGGDKIAEMIKQGMVLVFELEK